MPNPLGMTLAMKPTVPDPSKPTVAPVNVGQIYQNSYADQMAQYQANVAKQNAMWGGLASIGGTLAGLPLGGGTSLGGKLVGNLFPSLTGNLTGNALPGLTGSGSLPGANLAESLPGGSTPASALNTAGTFGGSAVPASTSFLDAGSAAAPIADAGLGLGADTAAAGAAGGFDLASLLPFLALA